MASKIGSAATDGMSSLDSTIIVATFGGLASKATGGDFSQGAMTAATVHLFNHFSSNFTISNPDSFLDKIFRSLSGAAKTQVNKVADEVVERSSAEVGFEDCLYVCLGGTVETNSSGNTYLEGAATGIMGKFSPVGAYKFNVLNYGTDVPLYQGYNFLDVGAFYFIGWEYSTKHWVDDQGIVQENTEVNIIIGPAVGGGAALGKGRRIH